MIDCKDIEGRGSSCLVYFKDLPDDDFGGAIYIENEYHKLFNRYLRRWGWWLKKVLFKKYKYGYVEFTYVPSCSKKIKREKLAYRYPFLSKEVLRKIPDIKTTDLLDYLEDPDDARFLKPGFLFHREQKDNGISVYEYYPLAVIDDYIISYKKQIAEILEYQKEKAKNYSKPKEYRGIGNSGLFCIGYEKNEDYADNKFESLDVQTQEKITLFKKQVEELKKCGIPTEMLEKIIHQSSQLSKLVITKKYEILLPDYNNMVIKMEPLVKAIFLLFLKHPEGIIFKHLPDYRQELIDIYKHLRPLGLNERSLQSIEDVTNPFLNSINEKCARIRSVFCSKFDVYLAQHYYITGKRGEAKKIALPRDLVTWE
jgi:hypothetical protein